MNARFLNKPAVRFISRTQVQTIDTLYFVADDGREHQVPAGYTSDLASIYVLLTICQGAAVTAIAASLLSSVLAYWLMLLAVVTVALYALLAGYAMRPALLHDWLYGNAEVSRRDADRLFWQAMAADDISPWRRVIFFTGVRLFGWVSYGEAR